MHHLIYLHGFLSSPKSVKATQTLAFFEQHAPHIKCHFPTLPGYPLQAVEAIEKVIAGIVVDKSENPYDAYYTLDENNAEDKQRPYEKSTYEQSTYEQSTYQQSLNQTVDKTQHQLRFIGSSMGGYLATYFVEKYGGKAVIVNPAVTPYDLLVDYMGEHINPNTKERFEIAPAQIEQLRSLDTKLLKKPQSYKVLLQTLDETLDYTLAENKYQGADLVIEQGGNHSFEGYQHHLPAIYAFLFAE